MVTGAVSVARPQGELDLFSAPRLEAALLGQLDLGIVELLVLDLSAVTFLDSSAPAVMVEAARLGRQNLVRFVLVRPRQPVDRAVASRAAGNMPGSGRRPTGRPSGLLAPTGHVRERAAPRSAVTPSPATGDPSVHIAPPPAVPAAVDPLPDETVRAVVTEVALETVAECTAQADPRHGVEYTDVVSRAACAAAIECVPLAPVLGVEAAHLHRNATGLRDGEPDRPAGLPVVLRLVAALISSRVARDLLDVRLARALHDVAHLRVAQTSNRTIGVAVGVLMTTRRCSAEAAFELLRQASQVQNRKVRDIAAEVPYTGTIPDGPRRPVPPAR